MINYTKTGELHGMTADEAKAYFTRYPKSCKAVVAICDTCGDERTVNKTGCGDICKSCSAKARWENQDLHTALSNTMKEYWADPENKASYAAKMKPHYIDPEYKKALSEAKSKYWADEMSHENMSETMIASEAHKIASEAMVGGHDMVNHHYIYDSDDKHEFTVQMTRSDHTTMHANLRAQGAC